MGFLAGLMGGGDSGGGYAPAPVAQTAPAPAAQIGQETQQTDANATTSNVNKKKAVLGLSSAKNTLGSTSSSATTIGKTSLLGG